MNSDAQSEEVFLATTALEEFWDVSKPIVFLGEWCLLYERRAYQGGHISGSQLRSPYDTANAAENAYNYVNRLYEKLLPVLGAKLNAIHEKNYSSRYWRILLGPWLQLYLSAVYDRFVHLAQAIDEIPNFTTIGLSTTSFVVPTDTLDFACFLSEDSYNLQLYTKLLRALGKEFPCKEAAVPRNPLYGKLLRNSWRRKSISYALKVFADVSAKLSKTILLRNPYFSKLIETQLITRNIGKVLPSWNQISRCSGFDVDSKKRNVLLDIEIGKDEFEQCLSAILSSDVPQCFIEGFRAVENEANRTYPKRTNAIFSANAWYYDESFKQWAARSAEQGTLLLGTQHGGNYGSIKSMPSEDHETSIVDYYYSWGWERSDCAAKVVPMPATKLLGRKKLAPDNNKKDVLWVATSSPRYVSQLPFVPMHFKEYLAWQIRFANALSAGIMNVTRYRPHYENYSWGTVERMKDCKPAIRIEFWDVPFQVSLENCRLYVCDHLSTTFAEALAANQPTILFFNPQTNPLRLDAQSYFDLLKDCGLLFDTPEAAAAAVVSVYDDVETWWNALDRQRAIRLFCERFARTAPDALTLWSNELARVSKLQSTL